MIESSSQRLVITYRTNCAQKGSIQGLTPMIQRLTRGRLNTAMRFAKEKLVAVCSTHIKMERSNDGIQGQLISVLFELKKPLPPSFWNQVVDCFVSEMQVILALQPLGQPMVFESKQLFLDVTQEQEYELTADTPSFPYTANPVKTVYGLKIVPDVTNSCTTEMTAANALNAVVVNNLKQALLPFKAKVTRAYKAPSIKKEGYAFINVSDIKSDTGMLQQEALTVSTVVSNSVASQQQPAYQAWAMTAVATRTYTEKVPL